MRPLVLVVVCLALAAYGISQAQDASAPREGRLQNSSIRESSGVAASRLNPGIFWTHNDSGNGPVLYAFDDTGAGTGTWHVSGAKAEDWEDIAVGPGPQSGASYVYVGDIGDNLRRRPYVVVYRVHEPTAGGNSCSSPCPTEPAFPILLQYPDGPHNAEALLVHPATGDLYIITKAQRDDLETQVFAARAGELATGRANLKRVAALNLSDPLLVALLGGITGGDISPDGRSVVLCDYLKTHEAALPAGASFDEIWKQEFAESQLPLGNQFEGVCYRSDGKTIILTSEGSPGLLLEKPAGSSQEP